MSCNATNVLLTLTDATNYKLGSVILDITCRVLNGARVETILGSLFP